jgi:hypothetical protein
MGLAYSAIAQYSDFIPATVLDAWGLTDYSKNQFAVHGCPWKRQNESWIDFGKTEVYTTDCGPELSSYAPAKTYLTVDVINVYANNQKIKMPKEFQTTDNSLLFGSEKVWSIFDTCSSYIRAPKIVIQALKFLINRDGGLPASLENPYMIDEFLSGRSYLPVESSAFNWTILPSITFEIPSDAPLDLCYNKTIRFKLGPEHYIQETSSGCSNF